MVFRDINTALLQTFISLAESKSFTTTAQRLGRTQAAISLQLQKLEQLIGHSLLEREKRDFSLTSQGEILFRYAKQILALKQEMFASLKDQEVEGEVRLGTPEDFATLHLSSVLQHFIQTHPKIHLVVNCDFTVNLERDFQQGHYDLVLIKRPSNQIRDELVLWQEELVWAQSKLTPLVDSLKDEPELPLILAPHPCVYRQTAMDCLVQNNIPHRVVYTTPSLVGAFAALHAGLGVSVLPKTCLKERLKVVPNLPPLPHFHVTLQQQGNLSKPAQALAESLMEQIQ
jgi:DNA-binding transcriptional LysR family regulator